MDQVNENTDVIMSQTNAVLKDPTNIVWKLKIQKSELPYSEDRYPLIRYYSRT